MRQDCFLVCIVIQLLGHKLDPSSISGPVATDFIPISAIINHVSFYSDSKILRKGLFSIETSGY